MQNAAVLEALAVTAELCGREMSKAAAAVFAADLAGFDEKQIIGALKRCRMEVRGVLTVQDVVSRLDDGRPGPDEAFALIPASERDTSVWTDEIAQASAVAIPLLDIGDKAGARLAFREMYARLVREAREGRRPVNWWATLGHDSSGREAPIRRAVDAGRISSEYALELLPAPMSGSRAVEAVNGAINRP